MQPNQATILLVEDDINLAKMYKVKFSKEGLNMITAADGQEGLSLVTQTPVDIILLDMLLPKLTGTQFLQQLRALPQGKNIPVIILSNYSNQQDLDLAHKLGVKDYLSKAMTTPEKLSEIVRDYLSRTRG